MSIAGWIVLGAFIALFSVWWALPSLQGPQGFTGNTGEPGRDGEDGKTVVLIERKPVPFPPLPTITVRREDIEPQEVDFMAEMARLNHEAFRRWDAEENRKLMQIIYGSRP